MTSSSPPNVWFCHDVETPTTVCDLTRSSIALHDHAQAKEFQNPLLWIFRRPSLNIDYIRVWSPQLNMNNVLSRQCEERALRKPPEGCDWVADKHVVNKPARAQPGCHLCDQTWSGQGEESSMAALETPRSYSRWQRGLQRWQPRSFAAHFWRYLRRHHDTGWRTEQWGRCHRKAGLLLPTWAPARCCCSEKSVPIPGLDVWSYCQCGRLLPPRPYRHDWTRVATHTASCVLLLASGLAAGLMVNFHHRLRDTNQAIEPGCAEDVRWSWLGLPPPLGGLTHSIQCPSFSMYVASIATYSAAGLFHLTQPPRFWPELGLLAVMAAVLNSARLTSRAALVDGLILGGLLSLVSAYILEWLTWVYWLPYIRIWRARITCRERGGPGLG